MSLRGKPIFDYPPERRAPEGEGCVTPTNSHEANP